MNSNKRIIDERERKKRLARYKRRRRIKRSNFIRWTIFYLVVFIFVVLFAFGMKKLIAGKTSENIDTSQSESVNKDDKSKDFKESPSNERPKEEGDKASTDKDKDSESAKGFSPKLINISKTLDDTKVYDSKNEKSDVILELKKGEYLETYGSEDIWTKINYKNQVGYVKSENLENASKDNKFKVVDGLLIVNKAYSLPEDYDPGLKEDVEKSFNLMKSEMARDGLDIKIISGYRSYKDQEKTYNSQVKAYGKEEADRVAAKPGFSEHQTGYALDLFTNDDSVTVSNSFDSTREAEWLEKNSYKYGFILRYPKDKEEITGYAHESCHFRYVGPELAKKLFETGQTIEEYYNIEAKPLEEKGR